MTNMRRVTLRAVEDPSIAALGAALEALSRHDCARMPLPLRALFGRLQNEAESFIVPMEDAAQHNTDRHEGDEIVVVITLKPELRDPAFLAALRAGDFGAIEAHLKTLFPASAAPAETSRMGTA